DHDRLTAAHPRGARDIGVFRFALRPQQTIDQCPLDVCQLTPLRAHGDGDIASPSLRARLTADYPFSLQRRQHSRYLFGALPNMPAKACQVCRGIRVAGATHERLRDVDRGIHLAPYWKITR